MMDACCFKYRCGLVLLFMFLCFWGNAQQFSVHSFRLLPNDISAYINPVKDLNREACALIKVVGAPEFVFSTPLGIVKRKEEVGEIWIYVPSGTIQITIKHPQWGVLRDFNFESPLESRMTYELVLLPPKEQLLHSKEMKMVDGKPFRIAIHPKRVPEMTKLSVPFCGRVQIPWSYLLLASTGISKTTYSWGIRAGMIKRHGYYLTFSSKSYSMPKTIDECDGNGYVQSQGGIPYYTGKVLTGNWKAMLGGVYRLRGRFCMYGGVGYGEKSVVWETSDGDYLYNTGLSVKGVSAELGLLYHFQSLAFSVGTSSIKGKYWEATIGLGIFL